MVYPRNYNAATDMVDAHISAGRGDKAAFIDGTETLTYALLAERTNRVANLVRTYGIGRESRIALLLQDTIDYPPAFWGAIKAGAVPVALNTLLTSEQYKYILEDSRAQAIIVSSSLIAAIKPVLGQLPFLKFVFVAGGGETPPFALNFRDELAHQSAEAETAQTCADEVAFWLYSSGSTGMPKGTRHLHTSAMETARLYGQGVLGIREDDVMFSAAKIFFAYGLGNAMSFPLSVGATTILLPERPTPESVFRTLHKYQPTIFGCVPTLYASILHYEAGTKAASSQRLRQCISAGEALPAEVGKAWFDKFGVDILDGIGSTEMLHIFVSNRPGDVRYGTSGKPVPGYDVRLVDADARYGRHDALRRAAATREADERA